MSQIVDSSFIVTIISAYVPYYVFGVNVINPVLNYRNTMMMNGLYNAYQFSFPYKK